MISLKEQKTEIGKVCLSHHVKTLYTSAPSASEAVVDESELSLIVAFDPMNEELYADNYFDLKFSLQDLLGLPVELVEETSMDPVTRSRGEALRKKQLFTH